MKHQSSSLAALAAFVLCASLAPAAAQTPREVAEKVMPSVVLVVMEDARGEPIAYGSGFVVADGVIATNHHVFRGASSGHVRLVGATDEHSIRGFVAVDEDSDLVLLAVEGLRAPALKIGDSDLIRIGDDVFVVGNPQGLEGTFSQGIVSAIRRSEDLHLIQITAPISRGSSGGPVVNVQGEVIGVAMGTIDEGQNLNFVVPSSLLSPLVKPVGLMQPLSTKRTERDDTKSDDRVLFALAKVNRQYAEEGDAEAMFALAMMYVNGRGVPQDDREAVKWFRRAAEQGVAKAMFSLGMMYEEGRGVSEDAGEAVKWYRMAADDGDAEAMCNLGAMYKDGFGVAQDNSEAVRWFREAAEQGVGAAMYNLAIMYEFGRGVPYDDSEVLKWHHEAAEQGITDSMFRLGLVYAKDEREALTWYSKAAELGHSRAMYYLGTMYKEGRGVSKDAREALKWYQMAAERGDAGAMLNLAGMHANGRGVPKDVHEALKWYRKAAEAGDIYAMRRLGQLYADGQDLPKDEREAVKWFLKATEAGDAPTMADLAAMYADGRGVPQDYAKSYIWSSVAVAFGFEYARRHRDVVELQLTSEARLAAQARARELFEQISSRLEK